MDEKRKTKKNSVRSRRRSESSRSSKSAGPTGSKKKLQKRQGKQEVSLKFKSHASVKPPLPITREREPIIKITEEPESETVPQVDAITRAEANENDLLFNFLQRGIKDIVNLVSTPWYWRDGRKASVSIFNEFDLQ